MRYARGVVASLAAAALAGCASQPSVYVSAAAAKSALAQAGSPSSARSSSRPVALRPSASNPSGSRNLASPTSGVSERPRSASALPSASRHVTRSGARVAAALFNRVYFGSRHAASWTLLAPQVQRRIPEGVWIRVHVGCAARPGSAMTIRAVTVFGTVAIVTETINGLAPGTARVESVFNYGHGRWGYSPQDPSIYQHKSIAADISAARAAGFCGSAKSF